MCAGPGAPLGAGPLGAASGGARGYRGPAHAQDNGAAAGVFPSDRLVGASSGSCSVPVPPRAGGVPRAARRCGRSRAALRRRVRLVGADVVGRRARDRRRRCGRTRRPVRAPRRSRPVYTPVRTASTSVLAPAAGRAGRRRRPRPRARGRCGVRRGTRGTRRPGRGAPSRAARTAATGHRAATRAGRRTTAGPAGRCRASSVSATSRRTVCGVVALAGAEHEQARGGCARPPAARAGRGRPGGCPSPPARAGSAGGSGRPPDDVTPSSWHQGRRWTRPAGPDRRRGRRGRRGLIRTTGGGSEPARGIGRVSRRAPAPRRRGYSTVQPCSAPELGDRDAVDGDLVPRRGAVGHLDRADQLGAGGLVEPFQVRSQRLHMFGLRLPGAAVADVAASPARRGSSGRRPRARWPQGGSSR